MIQKRPRLRGFCGFWTETETAFFRSPPPEKLNLLPRLFGENRAPCPAALIPGLAGFALNAGLRPAGLGMLPKLNFGSRTRRRRLGITALRLPHFFILPMSLSPPCIPAVKPPPLTIAIREEDKKKNASHGAKYREKRSCP